MAKLFEPLTLRGLTLPNRIAVSPMCEYSAQNGMANDWHLVHLGARAVGGAGLVMTEATAVVPEGRISPEDLGIWSDDHIAPLARIADFIRSQGSVAAIQLAHAGRKASTYRPWSGSGAVAPEKGGWSVLAPSPIRFADDYPQPNEMTASYIAKLPQAFALAAQRALKAGFQVAEVHAAHGYLLHQFLSPISNQRSDNYGGSFENRIRLLEETVKAVRAVWPDELPIMVRVSATDWAEESGVAKGWAAHDTVELSRRLKHLGVDLMDISSGGTLAQASIPVGPGYQVPFSARVRKEAEIATGAVGMITEAEQAEEILQSGKADLIFIARELLRDPHWPLHAAQKLGVTAAWPAQYLRAAPKGSTPRSL